MSLCFRPTTVCPGGITRPPAPPPSGARPCSCRRPRSGAVRQSGAVPQCGEAPPSGAVPQFGGAQPCGEAPRYGAARRCGAVPTVVERDKRPSSIGRLLLFELEIKRHTVLPEVVRVVREQPEGRDCCRRSRGAGYDEVRTIGARHSKTASGQVPRNESSL